MQRSAIGGPRAPGRYTPPQHRTGKHKGQADRLLGRAGAVYKEQEGGRRGRRRGRAKRSDAAGEEERSRRRAAALLPARFGLLERKVKPGKK